MNTPPTLRRLLDAFATGEASCEATTAAAVAAAQRAEGVFTRVNQSALEHAARIDQARRSGAAMAALAGAPIALKDLFAVRGQRTLAGSIALRGEAAVEAADAAVVGRLRRAAAVFIGRANMSEFAFSGLGINPHYGTPRSVWQRDVGRLPGGSSSGCAVAVAEGIVPASIGSDTAGSCRVPAAFNGVVGVKPSFGRLSLRGVYPLSPTSDAPGPIASDVDGCFLLDHVMTGRSGGAALPVLPAAALSSFRLLAPEGVVMEDLDAMVAQSFADALAWLRASGVVIEHSAWPSVDGAAALFAEGAVAVREAWQAHAARLARRGDDYDPFVRWRISAGKGVSAAMQQARYRRKAELTAAFHAQLRAAGGDALVYPTVQCVPPKLAETAVFADLPALNLKCLRNTATVNNVDACAITLPCHARSQAPVGLMLVAAHGADQRLYEIAAAVETVLETHRGA